MRSFSLFTSLTWTTVFLSILSQVVGQSPGSSTGLTFGEYPQTAVVGSTYQIGCDYGWPFTGATYITIILWRGTLPNDITTISTIAINHCGLFWTVDTQLAAGTDYGFELTTSGYYAYADPITIIDANITVTSSITTSILIASTAAMTTAPSTSRGLPSFAPSTSSAQSTALNTAATSSSPQSGLGTTAKIGLGLGIPLGLLIFGLLLYGAFYWGRWTRAAHQTKIAQQDDKTGAAEMPTKSNTAELSSDRYPVELPINTARQA